MSSGDFPSRLRAIRKDSGQPLEQVARSCGITRAAVSGFETGKFRPTSETILKLAKHFCVDPEDLAAGHIGQRELKMSELLELFDEIGLSKLEREVAAKVELAIKNLRWHSPEQRAKDQDAIARNVTQIDALLKKHDRRISDILLDLARLDASLSSRLR